MKCPIANFSPSIRYSSRWVTFSSFGAVRVALHIIRSSGRLLSYGARLSYAIELILLLSTPHIYAFSDRRSGIYEQKMRASPVYSLSCLHNIYEYEHLYAMLIVFSRFWLFVIIISGCPPFIITVAYRRWGKVFLHIFTTIFIYGCLPLSHSYTWYYQNILYMSVYIYYFKQGIIPRLGISTHILPNIWIFIRIFIYHICIL